MLSVFDSLRFLNGLTITLRLVLVCILSGLIGIERSAKNRPAGFRTHILVGIATAMASLTGHYIYLNLDLMADLTRIGAQVISGLGFIGAGTIIVTKKGAIKGLTTAAGLWATGIIGLAVGAGFYEGGIIATALVLFAETVMGRFGARIPHLPEFALRVSYTKKSALDDVLRCCKNHNAAITDLKIISHGTDEDSGEPLYLAKISLRSIRSLEPEAFSARLAAIAGIEDVQLA